jgi:signal transduction histidine kinase
MATKLNSLLEKVGGYLRSAGNWLINPPSTQTDHANSIFYSARLKLTGFYFITILVFSLTLTSGVRYLAQHDFDHSGAEQNGAIHRLIYGLYSAPPNTGNGFNQFESNQSAIVHHDLTMDVILINIIVAVIGGVLSYWFAGRTLKPIEEAHRAQARFASDASHELRTPLANLKVENEVFLKQNNFSEKEARELIESNLEEVQRLSNLASNLLALTQYENASLSLSTFSATDLVDEALKQIGKSASDKKIKIDQHIARRNINGNFDSLVQLLSIILDNAVKYSPKNKTIYIDGQYSNAQYNLSVRDEGEGIHVEDMPYIFDRLYRGDKSRTGNTGGYGLGLALGKEIARANNAKLSVRNYPGGGAQFVVSLASPKS